MEALIHQAIVWPFAHEATFWSLIIMFIVGIVIGRGGDGRWRAWFDLEVEHGNA